MTQHQLLINSSLIRVVFGAQIFLIISNAYVVVFHGTIQISTYRPDSSINLLPTHIPCIPFQSLFKIGPLGKKDHGNVVPPRCSYHEYMYR
jgi:hypothetical protein